MKPANKATEEHNEAAEPVQGRAQAKQNTREWKRHGRSREIPQISTAPRSAPVSPT